MARAATRPDPTNRADRRGRQTARRGRGAAGAARLVVDAALACALVLVMATPLAEEAAHEWLGIAVAVLAIAHLALNARRLRALLRRGTATPVRVVFVVVDVLLTACLIALVASSLVLSVHAFWWLPALPGAAWARPAHLLCSFWLFALSAFHLGLHMPVRLRRPVARAAALAFVVAAVAGGAAAFAWLDLGAYLLARVPFYAVDTSQPLAMRALAYVGAGSLVALAGALVRRALVPRREWRMLRRERERESAWNRGSADAWGVARRTDRAVRSRRPASPAGCGGRVGGRSGTSRQGNATRASRRPGEGETL